MLRCRPSTGAARREQRNPALPDFGRAVRRFVAGIGAQVRAPARALTQAPDPCAAALGQTSAVLRAAPDRAAKYGPLGNDARDIPLPRWLLTSVMPFGFVLLGVRLLQAARDPFTHDASE